MAKDYRVLFVQRKGEERVPLRELRLFFRGFPSVLEQVSRHTADEKDRPPFTFIFEDDTACVFFSFEYFPQLQRPVPEDFADTGLTLVLELARPPFFATTAIDLALQLAEKFNLLFLPPDSAKPIPVDKKRLILHYEQENLRTVEKARKKGQIIPFLPRERLLYWFNYTSNLPTIRKRFESSPVAVPALKILQFKNTTRAVTAFQWTRGRATLLPQADYVIVERAWHPPEKVLRGGVHLPGKRERIEIGLAPLSEVMDIVSLYAKGYSEPVSFLVYRVPLTPPEVRDSIRKLSLSDPGAYKVIRPDSVVEFAPHHAD